jgi:Domain of unknown function (DUF4259)
VVERSLDERWQSFSFTPPGILCVDIWGIGPFDDDLAADWLEDLNDSDPIAFFQHCLDLSDTDDLHYLACIGVVCTAAMLAGLVSQRFRSTLPETALAWIANHQHLQSEVPPLARQAIMGLGQVLSIDSEISVRWEDRGADQYEQWHQGIEQIAAELRIAVSIRK